MTDLRTPIYGHSVGQEGVYTTPSVANDAIKAAENVLDRPVLQDINALAGAFARLNAGGLNVRKLLPPSLQTTPRPDPQGGRALANSTLDGLNALAELYSDTRIREEELPALQMARGRLEHVLAMEPALKMLPKPVRLRLHEKLFAPLRALVAVAQNHTAIVMREVERRDLVPLQRRLSSWGWVTYGRLDVSRASTRSDFNGAHRYSEGDPIRITLEDGATVFGFVTHRRYSGALIAEWLDAHGDIHLAELSREKTVQDNPLKIGDTFEALGRKFWVTVDGQRTHCVVDDRGQRLDSLDLLNRLMPLERIASVSTSDGFYARNDGDSKLPVSRGQGGEVALHGDRDPGSKVVSDDAVCALLDGWGRIYVGVFDQTRRKTADPETHGAASKIAGETFRENMRELAARHAPIEHSVESMTHAIRYAHRTISARSKGELTTFVGAMIDGSRAVILNVGNSGVMHLDTRGLFIEKTREQGDSPFRPAAVGTTRRDPAPETYRWNLSRGDYLVFGSKELFECGLTRAQIGVTVAHAGNAEKATRELRDEVMKRMKGDGGKRSDLAIAVVRVGDPTS